MVGSVCRLKRSQLGPEILSRAFESRRWCPTRMPCWYCDRSNCAAGGRVDSSWQEDNDRQCSNCTRVFPWFSIQRNAWSFQASESVRTVGAQRTEGSKKQMNLMGLSVQRLLRYAGEGGNMLNRIVTGEDSWVHQYQLESKCASVQWKHPSSPSTKSIKITPSAGKVMFTVFSDSQGVLLAHFQKSDESVNSASYWEVLLKLRDAIRRKCPGQLAWGVLLYHNNARPHNARATQERIQELQRELLEHPPYNPDLALSDFHRFGPLKKKTLVENVSLMTKRLKRRCKGGWDNSQKTSILWVSTCW
jgi:hypothetical protein